MTNLLPPSLAAKPNIPLDQQTVEQLKVEREYWDNEIRSATGWGAAVGVAHEFRSACDKWIARREAER